MNRNLRFIGTSLRDAIPQALVAMSHPMKTRS